MPSILIVDDKSDWCVNLEAPLSSLQCEVITQQDRSRALDMINQRTFDVVVTNVCLDESVSDEQALIDKWIELVEHVSEKSEVIVVAAQSFIENEWHDLTRKAFRTFNAVDVLRKETFDETEYIRAVQEAIVNHYARPRWVDNRKYELRGVNQEIYSFLARRGVLERVFQGIEDYENRLFRALGGHLYDECLGETKKLLFDIWNIERGLFPYLFVDMLSEFEFDHKYYDKYRDHITHQLRVYLLGLYLYYGNPLIKKHINKRFSESDIEDTEAAFLHIWKITSIFHDLGYVFEVTEREYQDSVETIFGLLEDFFSRPLYLYCQEQGISLLEAQELDIREYIRLEDPRVKSAKRLLDYRGEDLLERINRLVKPARLSAYPDGLRRYFEYAQKAGSISDSKRKEAFIDHGIASAALLLRLHYFFEKYVLSIQEVISEGQIEEHLIEPLQFLDDENIVAEVQNCRKIVEHAGAAIALHNIQVDIWNKDDAWIDQKLTLNDYRLSLVKTPLAFLLALTDVLQDWDRPLFSVPSPTGYVSQDQDISIAFSGDHIIVDFTSDELRGTSKSKFRSLAAELKKYMEPEDIDRLLIENIEENSNR